MIPDRYNKENLIRAAKDPSLFTGEIRRQLQSIKHQPRKLYFKQKYGPGLDVMSQDWDYLIILDACRYDAFAGVVDLDGDLKCVTSRGSHSIEFCKKTLLETNTMIQSMLLPTDTVRDFHRMCSMI